MASKIITSKYSGDRLKEKSVYVYVDRNKLFINALVDSTRKYQEIIGFGGAFTEAAAVTLSKIDANLRNQVLGAYFDVDKGLGYNMGRIHINSCDFALGNYTYVDEMDENLGSFSIEHDMEYIIPLIKDAIIRRGAGIKLLASPWSPPGWMKTNKDMNHGGSLLDEYKSTWADYMVRFIKEYREAGLDIWGITVQNEPEAVQSWDSCIFTGKEERDFVKSFLGPAMHDAGLGNVKIIIHDHNRDIILKRAGEILSDPGAAGYIWGTGFHWYVSEDFENVGKVHDMYPDKHLLFTEGCQEGGVHIGDWSVGERYGRNIIGDMNNWCEGYLDWNIVLDEMGGPNHVGNYCDAPIICNTKEGKLHFNNSYYYIGHFSKYVKPGSRRIHSECNAESIHLAAFETPEGMTVVVIMNEGDAETKLGVDVDGLYLQESIEPHSITTYII
ncbi:MAG: glycoside hydrolase family 30 protein [Clostridia bacterium]